MTSVEVAIRFFERHLKEDILKYGERQAIHMAISALREQPRWISVDERLPEPDTDVLARRSIGTMDVEVYHEDEVAWTWDGYSKGFVTHWMPLPEPPEVEV